MEEPTTEPSTRSSTLVTATLSAAAATTETEPETVAPAEGLLIEVVGATVSAGGAPVLARANEWIFWSGVRKATWGWLTRKTSRPGSRAPLAVLYER